MQSKALNLFTEATSRAEAAFRFNQATITCFYVIITHFYVIITSLLRMIMSLLLHYYIFLNLLPGVRCPSGDWRRRIKSAQSPDAKAVRDSFRR